LERESSPLQQERELKRTQDEDFKASLRVDREKARLKKLEEELQQVKNAIIESRKDKMKQMLPEPSESDLSCAILLRLPSGTKVTRRFYKVEEVQTVFDFIEGNLVDSEYLDEYIVATHFPRKVLTEVDKKVSVQKVLGDDKSHTLFVEKP